MTLDRKSKLMINECNFTNNSAKFLSNIFCISNIMTTVINSRFSNNRCKRGGAISTRKTIYRYKALFGSVVIANSTFTNNTASEFGGTIYHTGISTLILKNILKIGPTNKRYRSVTGRLIYSEAPLMMDNVRLTVKYTTESSSILFFKSHSDAKIYLQNYSMVCPVGHKAKSFGGFKNGRNYFTSFCIPCGKGKYSLSQGEEHTDTKGAYMQRNNITCSLCVPGGLCDSKIKSVGNYWGHAKKNGPTMCWRL